MSSLSSLFLYPHCTRDGEEAEEAGGAEGAGEQGVQEAALFLVGCSLGIGCIGFAVPLPSSLALGTWHLALRWVLAVAYTQHSN